MHLPHDLVLTMPFHALSWVCIMMMITWVSFERLCARLVNHALRVRFSKNKILNGFTQSSTVMLSASEAFWCQARDASLAFELTRQLCHPECNEASRSSE